LATLNNLKAKSVFQEFVGGFNLVNNVDDGAVRNNGGSGFKDFVIVIRDTRDVLDDRNSFV
jgi:hypothetical protein